MNSHRIKAILADPDFAEFSGNYLKKQQDKVMAFATTGKDRKIALTEHHALTRFLKAMEAEAQNAKDD